MKRKKNKKSYNVTPVAVSNLIDVGVDYKAVDLDFSIVSEKSNINVRAEFSMCMRAGKKKYKDKIYLYVDDIKVHDGSSAFPFTDANALHDYVETISVNTYKAKNFFNEPTESEIRVTKKKGCYFLVGDLMGIPIDNELHHELIPLAIIDPSDNTAGVVPDHLFSFVCTAIDPTTR